MRLIPFVIRDGWSSFAIAHMHLSFIRESGLTQSFGHTVIGRSFSQRHNRVE